MSLERKLQTWQDAGLIDADTAQRIAAHEDSKRRPMALYALVGLASLAIGIGLIAIVAANWGAIPRAVKLAIDLLFGGALAAALYRINGSGPRWAIEALVVIYYLFVLASFALVGQVYQTGTPAHHALLVWSLCTLPLLGLAQSWLTGWLWCAGLVLTYAATATAITGDLDSQADAGLLFGFLAPIAFAAVGRTSFFRDKRPHIAKAFESVAWVYIVLSAVGLSIAWYFDIGGEFGALSLGVCAVTAVIMAAAVGTLYAPVDATRKLALRVAMAVYGLSWLLPLIGSRSDLPVVGGLAGLAVLAVYAWIALVFGRSSLFGALTLAIALRIVVVYFELFGTLMSTGLGLLSGGVVVLVVAGMWWKLSSKMRSELAEEESHGA